MEEAVINLKSIVVGVDFSDASQAALALATRIAAWGGGGAELHAVHAAELPIAYMPDPAFFPEATLMLDQDPIGDAKLAWKSFAERVPGAASAQFHVSIANPVIEIGRVAKETGAGLIVVGSNSLSRGGPGPVAAGCVRHAAVPVLLARPADSKESAFRRVLACVDFSEGSTRAVEAAIRIATQDHAALSLLHVFWGPWRGRKLAPLDPLASSDVQERYRESIVEHLKTFLAPMSHELSFLKASYHAVEDRNYGQAIAHWATWVGADLVVLGTRGKTNLRDIVLGSTAERTLRDARCSVLAVP